MTLNTFFHDSILCFLYELYRGVPSENHYIKIIIVQWMNTWTHALWQRKSVSWWQKRLHPNFPGPYHQTSLRWAGFKAMKMSRANPVFHMPRVKIYKRHVKTYHAYLKSFPQNKLPLPLTCQLCDQKPWKEDLPLPTLFSWSPSCEMISQ